MSNSSFDENNARQRDESDPLKAYRDQFHIPTDRDGKPVVYFCGNSLGLQPKGVATSVQQELEDWKHLGVDGHFEGATPWFSYHEVLRDSLARLVGARPNEVVAMNGLTVNLHLLMVSLFRPRGERRKILIEYPAFPSDLYAIQTQLRVNGCDPKADLIQLRPRDGEHTLRTEDIQSTLDEYGHEIAVVMLGGVNFFTGQVLDMRAITAHVRQKGCVVGWDLAHAVGNVPLSLHEWDADFAVWCSYKYLNSGPGAVSGCYLHERHACNRELPRFGGWWGNDPETRFRMHLEEQFRPVASADAWQLSNPPILALAPLKTSLAMFDEVGMPALRAKSEQLTDYLAQLLELRLPREVEVITPAEPSARGCQLSLLIHDRPRERFEALQRAGIVVDFRQPNVVRVAPVPLYNSFHDAWRFARALE